MSFIITNILLRPKLKMSFQSLMLQLSKISKKLSLLQRYTVRRTTQLAKQALSPLRWFSIHKMLLESNTISREKFLGFLWLIKTSIRESWIQSSLLTKFKLTRKTQGSISKTRSSLTSLNKLLCSSTSPLQTSFPSLVVFLPLTNQLLRLWLDTRFSGTLLTLRTLSKERTSRKFVSTS